MAVRVNYNNCQRIVALLERCEHLAAYVKEAHFDFCTSCHDTESGCNICLSGLPYSGRNCAPTRCTDAETKLFSLVSRKLDYLHIRGKDLPSVLLRLGGQGRAHRTHVELRRIASYPDKTPSDTPLETEAYLRYRLCLESLYVREMSVESLLLQTISRSFSKLKHITVKQGSRDAFCLVSEILR